MTDYILSACCPQCTCFVCDQGTTPLTINLTASGFRTANPPLWPDLTALNGSSVLNGAYGVQGANGVPFGPTGGPGCCYISDAISTSTGDQYWLVRLTGDLILGQISIFAYRVGITGSGSLDGGQVQTLAVPTDCSTGFSFTFSGNNGGDTPYSGRSITVSW